MVTTCTLAHSRTYLEAVSLFKIVDVIQAWVCIDKLISLGVGAYRTDEGKPWILPTVKKAEKILAEQIEKEEINHEKYI